jgi:hypothetical protein
MAASSIASNSHHGSRASSQKDLPAMEADYLPSYAEAQNDPSPPMSEAQDGSTRATAWTDQLQQHGLGEVTLALHHPLIYCSATVMGMGMDIPMYHMQTRNGSSGKPWQLSIRHVLPGEQRQLVMLASEQQQQQQQPGHHEEAQTQTQTYLRYDDDLTIYLAQETSALLAPGLFSGVCIRGSKKRSLPGTITMEKSHAAMARAVHKFWHVTPILSTLSAAENERRQRIMHRRGYRDSDDWAKALLFLVRGGSRGKGSLSSSSSGSGSGSVSGGLEWTDKKGKVIAREAAADGKLRVVAELTREEMDVLVACWASKRWHQGKLCKS